MRFKCCFDIYWPKTIATNEDWVSNFETLEDVEEWAAKYANDLIVASNGRLTHDDVVYWVEEYHNG